MRLIATLVLTLPEGNDGFAIYSDAYKLGLGAYLCNMVKWRRVPREN